MLRNRLTEILSQTEAEKEWWEKRRASIHTDLMKDSDTRASGSATKLGASPGKSTSDEDAVLVENPSASETGSMRKKKSKK
jgi:translocation protein SEC66